MTCKYRLPVIIIGTALILSYLLVNASNAFNEDGGVQTQQHKAKGKLITVTGTSSDEKILIREYVLDSEICAPSGVVVSGLGVTSLGQVPSCPSNEPFGWDITPNPDGINTRYKVVGNGISTQADRVEIHDGGTIDNDIFFLDVNQFSIFDGPGDDKYSLVGDLVDFGESISFSDSTGNDKLEFVERG